MRSIQHAVDQNLAPVISVSFHQCEQERELPELLRSVAQQANAEGITWINGSGDAGAADCNRDVNTDGSYPSQATKGRAVNFLASMPEVTGVGGTQFNGDNGNYWASANGDSHASALS
jgi:subtilase family serine protease